MLIGAFVVTWFVPPVYRTFAFTDTSFQEGLRAALKNLDLPVEDQLGFLDLQEQQADIIRLQAPRVMLRVSFHGGWAEATLSMPRQYSGLLRDIVKHMNEYYRNTPEPSVNLRGCKCFLIAGLFMVLLAGVQVFVLR